MNSRDIDLILPLYQRFIKLKRRVLAVAPRTGGQGGDGQPEDGHSGHAAHCAARPPPRKEEQPEHGRIGSLGDQASGSTASPPRGLVQHRTPNRAGARRQQDRSSAPGRYGSPLFSVAALAVGPKRRGGGAEHVGSRTFGGAWDLIRARRKRSAAPFSRSAPCVPKGKGGR